MNYYSLQRNSTATSRSNRRKKLHRLSVALVFLMFALSGSYSFVAYKSLPKGEVFLSDFSLDKEQDLGIKWPSIGQAAIGTSSSSVTFKSSQKEEPKPIASMAKVITLLAVLEKAPMKINETGINITLDTSDEELFRQYLAKDGSVTPVKAGDVMNQYQAMQTILLPSSNNMTDTLVNKVFGSVNNYVIYANKMVANFGLRNTRLADASGFSPDTVSTPSDMISIGRIALKHPVLQEIMAQKSASIPGVGNINNANRLLDTENVVGIKPGNTDEAGWCLLFAATTSSNQKSEEFHIGVVMGSDSPIELFNSSKDMLESSKTMLNKSEIIRSGQNLGKYRTAWTDADFDIVAKESLYADYTASNKPVLIFNPNETKPPFSAGEVIGTIKVGKDSKASIPVISKQDVPAPSLFWKLFHISSY